MVSSENHRTLEIKSGAGFVRIMLLRHERGASASMQVAKRATVATIPTRLIAGWLDAPYVLD